MNKAFLLAGIIALITVAGCSSGDSKDGKADSVAPDTIMDRNSETESEQEADRLPVKTEKERKTSPEDKVMDIVWQIREVQELDATIRKKSGNKRGISTFINGEPSDDQEYYSVSVAEDNGSAMATYFQFHVYPDFSVRYYDVVEDREITLQEWRDSKED